MREDIESLEEEDIEDIVEELILGDHPYSRSPFLTDPKTGKDEVDHLRGLLIEDGEKTSEVIVDHALGRLWENSYEDADRYLRNLNILYGFEALKEEVEERNSEWKGSLEGTITDEGVPSNLLDRIRHFSYDRFGIPVLANIGWDELIDPHLGSESKERTVATFAYKEHKGDLKAQAEIWKKMYDRGARPLKPDSDEEYWPVFGLYALQRDERDNDSRGLDYLRGLVENENVVEEFREDVQVLMDRHYDEN